MELICSECGKVFVTESALAKHKRLHFERFECELCKRTFNRIDSFKLHQTIHRDQSSRENNKIQCGLCQKTFFWRSSLRRHMESHGVKNLHICGCNKVFQKYTSFYKHKVKCAKYDAKQVNNAKSPKKIPYTGMFSCQMCSKEFNDRDVFEKHVDNCDILFPEDELISDMTGDSENMVLAKSGTDNKNLLNTKSTSDPGAKKLIADIENEDNLYEEVKSTNTQSAKVIGSDDIKVTGSHNVIKEDGTNMTDSDTQFGTKVLHVLPIPAIHKPTSEKSTHSTAKSSNPSLKGCSKRKTVNDASVMKTARKETIVKNVQLKTLAKRIKDTTLEIDTPKETGHYEHAGVRKSGRKRKLKTFEDYETDMITTNVESPKSCKNTTGNTFQTNDANTSIPSKKSKSKSAVKSRVRFLIKSEPPTSQRKVSKSTEEKTSVKNVESEMLSKENEHMSNESDSLKKTIMPKTGSPLMKLPKIKLTEQKKGVTCSTSNGEKVKSRLIIEKRDVPFITTVTAGTVSNHDEKATEAESVEGDDAYDDGDDDDDFIDLAGFDSDADTEYKPEMSDGDTEDSESDNIKNKSKFQHFKTDGLKTGRSYGHRKHKVNIKQEKLDYEQMSKSSGVNYYCPFCDDRPSFTVYSECETHLNEEHPDLNSVSQLYQTNKFDPAFCITEGERTCSTCSKSFADTEGLRSHVNIFHASNQFCCGLCRHTFNSMRKLEQHISTHHQDTSLDDSHSENTNVSQTVQCTDPACQKKNVKIGFTKIGIHRSSVHNKKDTYLCKACCKHFVGIRSARAHLAITHFQLAFVELTIVGAVFVNDGTNSRFQCCRCTFVSKDATEQDTHRCIPTGLKYYCPFCKEGLSFLKLEDCEIHMTETHSEAYKKSQACNSIKSNRGKPTTELDPAESIKDGETVCTACSISCSTTEDLRLHVNSAHAPLPFCCGLCRRTYGRLQTLSKHQLVHLLIHRCEECVQYFPSHSELAEHISKHPAEKEVTCKICMMKFYTKSALQEHRKARHSEHLQRSERSHGSSCICDVCGKMFPGPKSMEKHMFSHSVESARCNYCFKVMCKDKLAEHTCEGLSKYSRDKRTKLEAPADSIDRKAFYSKLIVIDNSGEADKPFKCTLCLRTFRTRKFATKHISNMHTMNNQKSFKCKICNKGFIVSRALRLHMRSHSGSRPYKCRICSKAYRQKVHVLEHLKSHSRTNLYCRYCKQAFRTVKSLQNHVEIHSTIMPYKCYVSKCDLAFINLEKLKIHFKEYHNLNEMGSSAFHCNICSVYFSNANGAEQHLEEHMGQRYKLFQCETCPLTFDTFRQLYTHMDKTEHFQDPNLLASPEAIEDSDSKTNQTANRKPRFRIKQVDWDLDDLMTQYDYFADEDPDMFMPTPKNDDGTNMNSFSYEEIVESPAIIDEPEGGNTAGKFATLAGYLSGNASERSDHCNTNVIEDQFADNVLNKMSTQDNDDGAAYILEMSEDQGMILIPTSLPIRETEFPVTMTQSCMAISEPMIEPPPEVVDVKYNIAGQNAVNDTNNDIKPAVIMASQKVVPKKKTKKVVDALGNEVQFLDESGEQINVNDLEEQFLLEGFTIVEVEEETNDELEELGRIEGASTAFDTVGEDNTAIKGVTEHSAAVDLASLKQEPCDSEDINIDPAAKSLESQVAKSIGNIQNVVEYGSGNVEAATLVETELMDEVAKDALHSVYRHQKRAMLPFECTICGMRFRKVKYLNVHKKIHWRPEQHKHQCKVCGKGFSKPSQIEIHMRTHTKEKPYQCKYCEKTFRQKGHLKEHVKRHESEYRYKCQFCDYKAFDSTSRKNHILRHHKVEMLDIAKAVGNVLECKQCGLEFLEAHEYTLHNLEKHLEENVQADILMQFSDEADNKALLQRTLLTKSKQEAVVKTGPSELHVCDVCGLVLGAAQTLKTHLLKHQIDSGELYGCQHCGKRFGAKTLEELNEHISLKHGNITQCQCDICGMVLENRLSLKRHMKNKHHRSKLQCSKCAKAFVSKVSFVAHIRSCFGQEFEGKLEESLFDL